MNITQRQNIYDNFQFTYIILCLIILILIFINSIYNITVVYSKSYDKILKDIKKNISVSSLKDYKILCNYYIDDNFKYNDILLSMNVYNDIFTSYSYFTIACVIFIIVILVFNFISKDDESKNENKFLFFNTNYYNFSIEDKNTNYIKILLILIPFICFILFIVYMGLYGAIINEKKIYDYRLANNTTESIEQLIFNDYKNKLLVGDNKAYNILLNHILNNNNKYNFIDLCPTKDIESDINGNVKYFIDKMAKANGIEIDKSNSNIEEHPKYIFLHNILHMCAILCKINENTNVDVVKTFRDFFKKCEYYNTHSDLPEQWQTYGNKINSDIHLTFYELIFKNINSFVKIFVDIKDNLYAEEKDIYASKVIFLHSLLTKYYLDNYDDENINNLISNDDNNSYTRKLLGKKKTESDNDAKKEKDFFKNKIKFFKGITEGMIISNLVITSSILFLILFFYRDKFKKFLDIFKYSDTINYLLTLLIKNSHKHTIIVPILISILNFINDYFHIVIPIIILSLIITFIILISTLT